MKIDKSAYGEDYNKERNEKIVKIDFKEAELAKVLADHYSSLNDMETAINYYKKSILRYINIENYNASKCVVIKNCSG
mgnify:CR=1 FL=1